MKSNTTKLIILASGIFALGFFAGFFTNHYFFQPSNTPPTINEERKRIHSLTDSAFVSEFEREFSPKSANRKSIR